MVRLRLATRNDMDLLFEWANDPIVRINSFKSELIKYEDHKRWFDYIINDETVIQYLMMDDNIPVGQIRLNINDDKAEIGYSISSKFRNKGYGHKILQLMYDEVKHNHPEIKKLIAKVKPDNKVSMKLFETEGYTMEYSCFCLDV